LRPAAVWPGRCCFSLGGVSCLLLLLVRSCVCRPCARCRWCRGCGVVGSLGVGRPRLGRSCGSACGLGGSGVRLRVRVGRCAGRRGRASRGVRRGGGSTALRLARSSSSVRSWGPCVGLLRRAVPFFSAITHTKRLIAAARPCLRAAEARPLRRDQPRGVFKRQRRLAKRGYANDQGLNQTSG
jgi:hypothetical protein